LPEATVTRRITRAKQTIVDTGGQFALPDPAEWPRRLDVVLHVIYLIFTEGHTASAGDALVRGDLCAEAIRLGRLVRCLLPDEPEVDGLLAQMLLTDSRRAARTGPDSELVPLAEQDRARWDQAAIAEGITLVTGALSRHRPGPYQLQAAINAVHAEAATYEDTDWPQILALYGVLDRLSADPVVTLNRAVALAEVEGPEAGLAPPRAGRRRSPPGGSPTRARRPRPPAADHGTHERGRRGVPTRGARHPQHPRASLPAAPRGPRRARDGVPLTSSYL
jgi:predicted RNA polymerase sigma factor